ncbi:MAG TPA: DUF6067 family protein [Candidatus Paceibacterota bacterium]|nr:DUF6067 family protein [Verrucomicrobiota bacterium]HSA08996.1 DUF6067 family protein [Candidatus Paceibacterota bacterium]
MRFHTVLLPTLLCGYPLLAASPDLPAPYTPVKASSSQFRCLGRETDLGKLLLPRQIVAAGQPLLAAPVRVVTEPDVLAGLKGKGRVITNTADKATWEWTGESAACRITARMTGECDGLCWYEFELCPKQPVKLSLLRLEIPRRAATAKYLHAANFTWTYLSSGLPELGGQWSDKFRPYVWLGDEERGLAWCAESARGWSLREPTRALQARTQGNVVLFSTTLLDHEVTISAPITLRFGLQASPLKPVSCAWRASARILHNITYAACAPGPDGRMQLDTLRDAGVKTAVIHDDWTDYYGQITPLDGERLRRLIRECHKRQIKLLVYVGYGLARRAPDLQGHHDEWSVMPLIPWSTPYRTEFRAFDATCARSGWADWLVKGIDQLFAEYELDGLYFDGTSEAFRCHNQAHGCGWKDSDGNLRADYPMLASRQLMRRIADTVRRHRPDAILDAHMSASLTLPTLAFCDSYWNGEQFETLKASDKFELPLHIFRTEFMGYAHGLDAEFLCYENRPFTLTEAIALAWLHGVEVRPYPRTLAQISPIWRAMDSFGACSARWLPYWSGSGATAGDESVKISSYLHPGKALLFVSHLKREPLRSTFRLDRKRLGLASGTLRAFDALTRIPVALKDDTVPLSFDGMGYGVIEIRDRHFKPLPAQQE